MAKETFESLVESALERVEEGGVVSVEQEEDWRGDVIVKLDNGQFLSVNNMGCWEE